MLFQHMKVVMMCDDLNDCQLNRHSELLYDDAPRHVASEEIWSE